MLNIDWFLLIGTLLFIAIYGVWKNQNHSSIKSYLKGDNKARWWTIGFSVMATQASAITFLSTPGQAYSDGMGVILFVFNPLLSMRQKMMDRRKGAKGLQAVKRELRNFIRQALPTIKGDTYSKSELMKLLGKVAKADEKNINNLMEEVDSAHHIHRLNRLSVFYPHLSRIWNQDRSLQRISTTKSRMSF